MKPRGRIVTALLAVMLVGCSGNGAATGAPTVVNPSATPSLAATQGPTPELTRAPVPIVLTGHIDVGGLTRAYHLVAPADAVDRDPLPLLLALHGFPSTMFEAESTGGFDKMALDPGAVVVYPQGYEGSWNAGACCGRASSEHIDDVGFFRALIDRMEADYPIDPGQVFMIGGSNGGQMAERAACELADRVAAIADVIGALLVECNPSQPVSVIAIHGTADTGIPIDGGGLGCQDTPCPAFDDTMERWRQLDGCTGDPTVTDDATIHETTWESCDNGTAVTFIKAKDRGHEWYTSEPDDRAVTWAFFTAHRRHSQTQ